MAEQLQNKDANVLQAQLNDLDVDTLQQLLQAAIANKSKVSANTASVTVKETGCTGMTEVQNDGQNEGNIVDDSENSETQIDGDGDESKKIIDNILDSSRLLWFCTIFFVLIQVDG